jgi:hypothetical protein
MTQEPTWDHDEIVWALLDAGESLPPSVRASILAGGRAVVPALIDVLLERTPGFPEASGEDFAPIHAVDLLADLKAPEGIDPMLTVLCTTDWDTIVHDRILVRLPEFGAAALEPLLRLLDKKRRGTVHDDLLAILGDLKIRDERIFDLLVKQLRKDPASGAMNLGGYGDPAALPLLNAAFDEFRPRRWHGLLERNRPLVELKDAIELLGGCLNAEQAAKFQHLVDEHEAITGKPVRSEPPTEAELMAMVERVKVEATRSKPGRNAPAGAAAVGSTRSVTCGRMRSGRSKGRRRAFPRRNRSRSSAGCGRTERDRANPDGWSPCGRS